eukprot:TRINITY_DN1244_c0_g1_i1.p2 TRINITY_DN1244_c0_g1~~TRINITY_DN1244_c0_g1_i1.p2  ORF type:complete len:357 (-),score=57.81 TRINITY_DN1244_c0_g1_i1:409-1479(-)
MSRRQNGMVPSLAVFGGVDGRMSFELKEEQVEALQNQLGRNLVLGSNLSFNRQQQPNGVEFVQWKSNHPCILKNFIQFEKSAKNKRVVVFLDYDGTLTPIVNDPERAYLSDHMRSTISNIAGLFPTAIVSGRSLEKLNSFVQLRELYYAGSHGMDIIGPLNPKSDSAPPVTFQPAAPFLEMMNSVYEKLETSLQEIAGATVEHNKFCVSAHFRNCDPSAWEDVVNAVNEVVGGNEELRITKGRKVLEVRPKIDWDKGRAILHLLEALELNEHEDVHPIYIGDDTTDEDAFRALNQLRRGFGILVSSKAKPTDAKFTLNDTIEVLSFLQKLVSWGKSDFNGWTRNGQCNGWKMSEVQ